MIAHPYAARFPMLDDEELERLAADIAENGLRQPIVLDSEGRILDGRNRWAACELAGVTPETVVYDGDDLAAYVLSANVERRHMSTGARAMSTALVLADSGKRANGKWAYGSVNVPDSERSSQWKQRMAEAGAVLDHAPDLAEQVVAGLLALDAAFKQAEQRRDAERQALAEQERIEAEEAEAAARLAELAPDYLEEVGGQFRTARQAFTAWEDENRAAAARERQEKAARAAAEEQKRKALTHTFTRMAEHVQGVGAYGNAPAAKAMEEFRPEYLHPVQLMRAFDVENLRAGIRFLEGLIEWKEAA